MTQTPDLPTVDFPGQWRWQSSYFINGSYKLSLQRKRWWGWQTVAYELYSRQYFGATTPERVAPKVIHKAEAALTEDRNSSFTVNAKDN